MPDEPTPSTVKRLFAACGNRCAFPKCKTLIRDPANNAFVGKMCHIHGEKPSAARYLASQTEDERRGYDNLIVMCSTCHDIIDDKENEELYPAETLRVWKMKQEKAATGKGVALSDTEVSHVIASMTRNTAINGSNIFTVNQMGGQVAHTITNVGPQPRRVTQAAANQLITTLRHHPPVDSFTTECLMGDVESDNLASTLVSILASSGWTWTGTRQSMFAVGAPRGIVVYTPNPTRTLEVFIGWLRAVGFQANGAVDPSLKEVRVFIGANL